MSLTPFCACAGELKEATDRKRASTPKRNAGREKFLLTPKVILTPSSLYHAASVLAFLSYRFGGGMIHDSLVPALACGVALQSAIPQRC
jgi:hypothetical protein